MSFQAYLDKSEAERGVRAPCRARRRPTWATVARPAPQRLTALVEEDVPVAVTEPVVMKALAGARS